MKQFKLSNRIKKLMSNPETTHEDYVQLFELYEKNNLNKIRKLTLVNVPKAKMISGALKSCIDAHGPITKLLISSATKRVMGSLTSNNEKKSLISKLIKWIN